ncbi:hypothetical protein KUTeg_021461 [Tegillarca granosa]|uniref:Uncharacterized protein n=1 Tax=Tegillarca granosa TaxID=220873 RepID=A0ABQ9E7T3_TEGGR|nr:hypothetical protein KUTeg_021461 [Tegillarca granosa]
MEKELKHFKLLKEFPNEKEAELLLGKGVHCYDIRFYETDIPPIGKFYSRVTKSHITSDDYAFAKTVWQTFVIIQTQLIL